MACESLSYNRGNPSAPGTRAVTGKKEFLPRIRQGDKARCTRISLELFRRILILRTRFNIRRKSSSEIRVHLALSPCLIRGKNSFFPVTARVPGADGFPRLYDKLSHAMSFIGQ